MTIKDAVYYSAMFLQLDETCQVLENGETDDETDRLLRLANLVASEIASEYYPLKSSVKLTTNDNAEIMLSDFPCNVVDIYSAVNTDGISVGIKQYHDRIILPKKGEYEIVYSFVMPTLTLDSEIPFPSKIGARVLAYGIACEYCLISSMADEGALWDKRYKDALENGTTPKREMRVKRRRWI